MTKCSKCGVLKSADGFYPRQDGRIYGPCKDCQREYSRQWRASNRTRKAEAARQYRSSYPERVIDSDRHHAIKQDRLLTGATQVPFKRADLFDRDGGMCQIEDCICPDGRAIRTMKWSSSDDWCWEPDHIIPLLSGGDDTIENCRSSHRACNRAREHAMRRMAS